MSEGRKKTIFVQVFVAVVVAFLISETSPWWWEKVFGPKDTPGPDGGPPGRFVTVTVDTVLFPGPNRSEPGITDLPEGGTFPVLDEHIEEHDEGSEKWFRIDCGDTIGWVFEGSVIREEE